MSEVKTCELGALIEFQRGYDLPKSEFRNGPYPVQSSNGILGYHIDYKVEGPGITIGRSGTVGIPHYLNENFYPHNTTLFVKDFKGNDRKYIYYLLKHLKLNDFKTGSGVPTMNRNHLHPLKVNAFIDKNYQVKLSSILSILDQKIALNNQINEELEAMAKTLYDYWFVQFDFPDENGKPYKSSGGKMVYNDQLKREIPEGWGVEAISNILDKVPNSNKIVREEYLDFGTIPVIDQSREFICGYTENQNSILTPNDGHIVFGDHTRIVKYINFEYARGADGTQIIISKNENVPTVLLYQFISSIDLSNYGYARHYKFLKEKLILVPNINISGKYSENAETIFNRIRQTIFENQELSQLRDWLLPMLMNGQVKVEENFRGVK
ncbi:restriction endonuclease subunit S [Streptococcus suis]|uniref:restriction endonuclease subunit S n=1 Tax=Streptococcus suis TaxID=1307 RepID=UPI003BA29041